MGMFDWIKAPQIDCPHCAKVIPANSSWQSKDDECTLDILDYRLVDRFYASCPHCGEWIEYVKKEGSELERNYDLITKHD